MTTTDRTTRTTRSTRSHGISRRLLTATVTAALAIPTLAAAPNTQLRLGDFDDGRVVVRPGQPFGPGGNGCTSGFVAGDDDYVAGRGGQRYLLVTAHCLHIEFDQTEEGETRWFGPGEGSPAFLYGMNPTYAAMESAGLDRGKERIGETAWVDRRIMWRYPDALAPADLANPTRDVGVVRLDDDVSVDPSVPELGTPAGVATDFATLHPDGTSAEVLYMYGRATGVGDVAGQAPPTALRTGVAQGWPDPASLCVQIAVSLYESGAPLMTEDGLAVGLMAGPTVGAHALVEGHVDEPCEASRVGLVSTLIVAFEEETGIRLHLLTEKAGPILR